MSASFRWNGIDSAVYGIHISSQPDLYQSAERINFQTVPGRHGTVAIPQGIDGEPVYDDVILSVDCILDSISQLESIGGWLTGCGKLVLPFVPNRYFRAYVTSQIAFSQIMRGRAPREFTVTFRCDPFIYHSDAYMQTLTSPATVNNPGNATSEPRFTVTLNGSDATLMVGSSSVLFSGLTGEVTIDTAAGIAYQGNLLVGASGIEMLGGWPVLKPGSNGVNWTGGISKVVIDPLWRSRL